MADDKKPARKRVTLTPQQQIDRRLAEIKAIEQRQVEKAKAKLGKAKERVAASAIRLEAAEAAHTKDKNELAYLERVVGQTTAPQPAAKS